MSEMNNYEDVMVDEDVLDEYESGGERDLSTLIGVGLIAGGGVVVYEGGKKIVKFVAPKVKNLAGKIKNRGKKAETEASEGVQAAETPPSSGEAK